MIVEYTMIVNDDIINFKSIGTLKNNVLSFKDMNNKENLISIEISDYEIIIHQSGGVDMQQRHRLNETHNAYYKGKFGVSMNYVCKTTKFLVETSLITLEYTCLSDNQVTSVNKLVIKY